MKQRRVTMEEGMQILLEELQPGEEKTPRDLINILQGNIEGISNTQCYGIIYRARTNADGVLQKKGKMYSLVDELMKQERSEERRVGKEGRARKRAAACEERKRDV